MSTWTSEVLASPSDMDWVLEMKEEHYEKMSKLIEKSLGARMPQMEIRFKDLSITADIPVATGHSDVPTLWTTFASRWLGLCRKRQTVERQILKPHTGHFKPGTMTLVLGQPLSGKSSLMKILSGRFPLTKRVRVEGDITYNGEAREDILPRLPQLVAYTNQRDAHYPTLTVQETFEFAHDCAGKLGERIAKDLNKGTAEENELAKNAIKTLDSRMPQLILSELGLTHCANTIVGNGMLRGVSGGERKRVTTGEMKFGGKLVSLLDEISTGLDAASTYDIVKALGGMAKHLNRTIVISLLQPPPEVLELFDIILILNDGYVMYHGPRNSVLKYFESLGFYCPPRRDVADFLLDLGTDQQSAYLSKPPLSPTSEHANTWTTVTAASLPQLPSDFAAKFKDSEIYRNMVRECDGPIDGAHFNSTLLVPRYYQSFWASTKTVMKRQFRLLVRNTAFIRGRFIMVLVMGLLYGSVFYQMDPGLPQVSLGLAFASILFIALGQASQIATFMEDRHIFYKQRGAHFYRTSSYVLSNTLAMIPFAVGESVVFGSIVYWLAGFANNVGAFVFFLLILFLANLCFASWFFFIASAVPNILVAQPMSFISILAYVLFAGFIIVKNSIPSYFIWLYWFNPLSWCFHALAVNEYSTEDFNKCIYKGVDYCKLTNNPDMTFGKYTLEQYGLTPGFQWVVYTLFYLVALYFVFSFMSYFFLEFRRYESPESTSVVAEEVPENDDDVYELYPSTPHTGTPTETPCLSPRIQTVSLTFQDIWYTVTNKEKEDIQLLKGVTGYALPGTITALMGSSGAGKTTLLDVLAGRKNSGTIQGSILLNGFPATPLAISRTTGYCEQMDNHCESATFREALEFSAFLRQSSDISDADKRASVQETIDLLEMHSIADKMIKGSSVEQMKRTKPLLPGLNPATWMLDVIGAGVAGASSGPVTDFAELYDKSPLKLRAAQVISESNSVTGKEMVFKKKRAATGATQLRFVCDRFFKMYWRTPSYNLIRLQLYAFLAVFLGIVYVRAEYTTFAGVNGGVGVIFLSSLFVGIIGFNSVLPLLVAERASYYRERACQTYNALWYFVGSTLVEVPYVFISTSIFTVIFYPFVGFQGIVSGVWYGFNLSLFVLMQVYFGELVICALPSLEVASIMGGFLMTLFNLFMGFNPPGSQIPAGYQWLYTITPPRYILAILTSIVFKCESPEDMGCKEMTNVSPQILQKFNVTKLSASDFVAKMYDMKYEDRWNHMYVILGCIVFFRFLALLCLRYVSHQTR
ncbi:unnamed protein product [Aphanomyces euteiches]